MMIGGGLMLIMGLFFMLLLVGLPILFVVLLVFGATGLWHKQNNPVTVGQNPQSVVYNPVAKPGYPAIEPTRFCAHCGAGLQADWKHCSQCGAPV